MKIQAFPHTVIDPLGEQINTMQTLHFIMQKKMNTEKYSQLTQAIQ